MVEEKSAEMRKRHAQLTNQLRREPDAATGGWRPGRGAAEEAGGGLARRGPSEPARFPQHVTLRVAEGVSSLARDGLMKIIRRAIRQSHKPDFRVTEFNVLGNHLHLITEAGHKDALSRGVAGLEVRLAYRLNSALKRRGKLFADRYHARYLRTPREVRNALRYVLLNRKHHDVEKRFARYWIDPYSSAAWFDGWAEPIRADAPWKRELVKQDAPTAKATVWLLTTGWRCHGLLRFDERPG